jgi:hypothetical protein
MVTLVIACGLAARAPERAINSATDLRELENSGCHHHTTAGTGNATGSPHRNTVADGWFEGWEMT